MADLYVGSFAIVTRATSKWHGRVGRIAKLAGAHAYLLLPEERQPVMVQKDHVEWHEGPFVERFVVTFINRDGHRQLFGAAQGRNTYATEAAAVEYLAALRSNNNLHTLASVVSGLEAVGTMEVRPCKCWPGHHDPKGIYFDA